MELKLTLSLLVVLFQLSRPWHIQFEIRPDVVFDYTSWKKRKRKTRPLLNGGSHLLCPEDIVDANHHLLQRKHGSRKSLLVFATQNERLKIRLKSKGKQRQAAPGRAIPGPTLCLKKTAVLRVEVVQRFKDQVQHNMVLLHDAL